MTHGAGFRVAGVLTRKFVAPSGKFAKLSMEANVQPKKRRVDIKVFGELVALVREQLGEGQEIEVTGDVGSETIKNSSGDAVKDNGRDIWTTSLTARAIKVDGAPLKPKELPPLETMDDVPF